MNRSFAVLSLALLLLTGCSGSDKSQDAAGSASPASSASASVSAGSAGSSNAQADASSSSSSNSSDSSTSTEAKPAPTFGPNHQELELTAEEQAAYQAGEYVPATEKHPALNVPVPVMPEKAKEHSFEGAKAFMDYWTETINYAIQTGDITYAKAITSSEWNSENELLKELDTLDKEGQWFSSVQEFLTVEDTGFVLESQDYVDIIVRNHRSGGSLCSLSDKPQIVDGFNLTDQPFTATLSWNGKNWIIEEIIGIQGVTYE